MQEKLANHQLFYMKKFHNTYKLSGILNKNILKRMEVRTMKKSRQKKPAFAVAIITVVSFLANYFALSVCPLKIRENIYIFA